MSVTTEEVSKKGRLKIKTKEKNKEKKEKKEKKFVDKYDYYIRSVQAPDADVEFLVNSFKELKGRKPKTMREDFCGTFAICCEWAKENSKFEAYGVDIAEEPIAYGQKNYLSKLNEEQKSRVHISHQNVLEPDLPQVDVACALNFSYFIFKDRKTQLKYFTNVYNSLNKGGLFVVDCFGGKECMEPNEEETEYDGFSYFWDQDSFDPVTNYAQFYIHFKPKGKKKIKQAFSYDWRMWSIPEIRDIMADAGFKNTHVYWEGTDDEGGGDGDYKRVEQGEDCEAWVAYIVGEK